MFHHFIIASIVVALAVEPVFARTEEEGPSYGVDVSFPIFKRISTNYPWLPHNTDPSMPTPKGLDRMPLQPLGDRQAVYNDHLMKCRKFYGEDGRKCDIYEYDRMLMNLRQPQR